MTTRGIDELAIRRMVNITTRGTDEWTTIGSNRITSEWVVGETTEELAVMKLTRPDE